MLKRFAFLLKLRADLVENLLQIHGIDGFQKILPHAQLDTLAGILKLIISAQHNDPDPRHLRPQSPAKLDAVHKGHLDVGDHDIRIRITDDGQRHLPVGGLSHKNIGRFLPGKGLADPLSDYDLIIRQKHFHFRRFPLWSCRAPGSSR